MFKKRYNRRSFLTMSAASMLPAASFGQEFEIPLQKPNLEEVSAAYRTKLDGQRYSTRNDPQGDTRSLNIYSGRTGDRIDLVYWEHGTYLDDALAEVNKFFRDWRSNTTVPIEKELLDIISASYKLLETSEALLLLSGYRSPKTNAMLRSRSRGIARNSLHTSGRAADLRAPNSRSVDQLFRASVAASGGGIGKYTGSNFVHLDNGPERVWGT